MNYARQARLFLLTLACAVLVACGSMAPIGGGESQPRGFNEYAATVLAGANEIVTTTRTLLAARKISPDDAANILKAAETAREGVAIARSITATDGPTAGTARLRAAATAIETHQRYLLTKGAP